MVFIYIEKACDRYFKKCVRIVEEGIISRLIMLGLLKICMREQRLRIRMLGRDLKDFLD